MGAEQEQQRVEVQGPARTDCTDCKEAIRGEGEEAGISEIIWKKS